jgi:hypothetical protein
VNVSLDNETVLSDVSFGDVSDYLTVTAGDANVSITVAGSPGAVVFSDNVTLDARTATTLYASGEVNPDTNTSFEPVAFEDDAFTPGENESALSIVHMSPDAPAVDVVVVEAPSDDETTNETATPTDVEETATPEEATGTETPAGTDTVTPEGTPGTATPTETPV